MVQYRAKASNGGGGRSQFGLFFFIVSSPRNLLKSKSVDHQEAIKAGSWEEWTRRSLNSPWGRVDVSWWNSGQKKPELLLILFYFLTDDRKNSFVWIRSLLLLFFLSTFFYSILTSQRTVCCLYNLFISHRESFRVGRGRRPGVVPPVAQINKQFNHTSGYALVSRTRKSHIRFHTGSSDDQLQWCRDASHRQILTIILKVLTKTRFSQ